MSTAEDHALILFDGVCNFCCTSVHFIVERDPRAHFRFASQQSALGQRKLVEAGLPFTMDTFILIEGNIAYTHSAAALKVVSRLTFPWPLCGIFRLVPGFLRDAAYEIIARNRYRWFGQKESCWVPSPEVRKRFLS